MTTPPEYGQVAEWLRTIDPDAGYLKGLERGYYDIKYAEDDGLTLETYVIRQWEFHAGHARRALDGIDLDGKSLDEVAAAYHDKQIAEYAARRRALQGQIRALESGDFEPPPRLADEAAQWGLSREQAKQEYRQQELGIAEEELGRLPGQYAVRDEEVEAYWAAASRTRTAAARGSGSRTTAKDAVTAAPGSPGFGAARQVKVADQIAASVPDLALVPTASQISYANVMAEAARRYKTRLQAEAERVCRAARAAGWDDRNANERARIAVHAADMAVGHWGRAERWRFHAEWQEPRRAAMLAWHGEHPAYARRQGTGAGTATESLIAPSASAGEDTRADLRRLHRDAADLMAQACIPGLEVSCRPERDEITVRIPEDTGDIRSRIAVIDRLAAITGGKSKPVPPVGDTCDRIEAGGQFAGHFVRIFTLARPQPGKPEDPDHATRQALAARQTTSAPAANRAKTTTPAMLAGVDFPGPVTAAGQSAYRSGSPVQTHADRPGESRRLR